MSVAEASVRHLPGVIVYVRSHGPLSVGASLGWSATTKLGRGLVPGRAATPAVVALESMESASGRTMLRASTRSAYRQ